MGTLIVVFVVGLAAALPPVVFMHGMGATSENMMILGRKYLKFVADMTGEEIYHKSVEIGIGPVDSVLRTFGAQTRMFAEAVRADPKLADGFDLVCHSQGGVICRGYVELYNDPPVRNLLTLVSPNAGEYGGLHDDCPIIGYNPLLVFLLSLIAYDPVMQDHLSIAGYWRDPYQVQRYRENCSFLPLLENERDYDDLRRQRVESLNRWIMVGTTVDEMIRPWGSSIGDFYQDGADAIVIPLEGRAVYKSNAYGIRTLNEEGKLIRVVSSNITHNAFGRDANDAWMRENVYIHMLD